MRRSAAATAVQLAGLDSEAKLALVEFMLTTNDIQASARRAIDWLVHHTTVKKAAVALADSVSSPLLLVAEHGVSSSAIAG